VLPVHWRVQFKLPHLLILVWKVSGLSGQHRESCQLLSSLLQSPIFVVDRRLTATVTHQVLRARLHGTLYLRTYMLSLILDCSENNLNHFSVWHLMHCGFYSGGYDNDDSVSVTAWSRPTVLVRRPSSLGGCPVAVTSAVCVFAAARRAAHSSSDCW